MVLERIRSIKKANSLLERERITWVQCQFTDISGRIRSFTCPSSDFINGRLWKEGMTFDGSSVGFAKTENSDLRAIPDPGSLLIMPYGESVQRVARVITDTYLSDGSAPFPSDPRNCAKSAAEEIVEMGYQRAHLQPELEFYLFRDGVDPLDRKRQGEPSYPLGIHDGYFASVPYDHSDPFRNEFCKNLMDAGMDIKFHHHEGGSEQVEIEFKHVNDLVLCADHSMLYKQLARLTARRFGMYVSFMPKLTTEDLGNGMHVHQWIEGGNGSVFHDPEDELSLSQAARYYIGGLLEHARAMCLITNPTVNSYKRLIPNFEAPVFAAWGGSNRTAMIRIPNSASSRRVGDIEVRHSDTSSNPYLVFSVMIKAGLDGIRRKIEPPPATSKDPNRMTPAERSDAGIVQLPSTLNEAVEAAKEDDRMRSWLGDDLFDAVVSMKEKEVLDHRAHVSEWERSRYLSL